jgi:signal transduction histidine kinase
MSAIALTSNRCLRAAAAGVLTMTAAMNAAAQAPVTRQVLVLQSMDRGSLVFDTFTASFRASLQERAGSQVTLFEFVVAPAGLAEAPDAPVIEFLRSIYAGRQPPALIVTVGGPAAAFARRHRSQLFPEAAMLLAAVETRYLGRETLAANETSVTVSIDYTGLIDDILQLLPGTRQVFMVTGSGPLSTFWRTELERNFERYRDRLSFIWSQDLTYDQMLDRTSALPPNSIIFYISSGTFATGSWQGEERTLADLTARANAPVFGAQGAWLGAGLVGGRLLRTDDLGATTAGVVMRILNGEPPSRITIPPRSIGSAVFDARQLRRWNIADARLPAGSEVRYRTPSLWRDYRRQMLGVLAALALQAALIVGLLYQSRARRRAEIESRNSLSIAADASRRMTMAALTGSIAHELSQPLNAILHNVQAGEMMMAASRATPEVLRDILADIRAADIRATEIIERHRTMLRNRQIEKALIDLHAVVHESVTLLAGDAKKRQIPVEVHLYADRSQVVGDHVLLQQVVVNLMVNAMDAMTDTPAPDRRLTLQSSAADGVVTVSVQDTGTGLPAGIDGNLFKPFVTTKDNGLGIGLTIARTIVEAHGGKIQARNNPDGGATFAVTLPRRE